VDTLIRPQAHRGGLILALGILGLVVCQVLGPFAWVMGNGELRGMDAGAIDPEGRGLVEAGRICGIVAAALLALPLVLGCLALLLFLAAAVLSGLH